MSDSCYEEIGVLAVYSAAAHHGAVPVFFIDEDLLEVD